MIWNVGNNTILHFIFVATLCQSYIIRHYVDEHLIQFNWYSKKMQKITFHSLFLPPISLVYIEHH